MNESILVVDDDPQITAFLERYLPKQHFQVTACGTAREMWEVLANKAIDLCVLDINLPDANGFELTQEIRKESNLPIIVLSVRDETIDRIFGLEFGADDYVTKPFEARELVARIRSVLRRSRLARLATVATAPGQVLLQVGHWIINTGERTVTDERNGETVGLTSMEFDLFTALAEHPRTVLSRNQLLDLARGAQIIVNDRTIDVHVMRLRKKIEADPSNPHLIKTVHGIGYCLATDVSRHKAGD